MVIGMSTVAVPLETALAVFDIAVGSMDFGSGFLDKEETDALRAYAELLGIDPMRGTSYNQKHNYCTEHDWEDWGTKRCKICGQRIEPDGTVRNPL